MIFAELPALAEPRPKLTEETRKSIHLLEQHEVPHEVLTRRLAIGTILAPKSYFDQKLVLVGAPDAKLDIPDFGNYTAIQGKRSWFAFLYKYLIFPVGSLTFQWTMARARKTPDRDPNKLFLNNALGFPVWWALGGYLRRNYSLRNPLWILPFGGEYLSNKSEAFSAAEQIKTISGNVREPDEFGESGDSNELIFVVRINQYSRVRNNLIERFKFAKDD